MAATYHDVNAFLKSMGFSEQLEVASPDNPDVRMAMVKHAGVYIQVWCMTDNLALLVDFAFMPKTAVAPLMRRLLELNFAYDDGYYFSIDPNDTIFYKTARPLEGLDLREFKAMCDSGAAGFLQLCVNLINEFELPTER